MPMPVMTMTRTIFLPAMLSLGLATAPGFAGVPKSRGDQDSAYAARQKGEVRSLREIEGRVVPRMPGSDYLGPEFDPRSGVYRLKFMRNGSVIWVDVDGRTGAVIGQSGR